MLLRPSAHALYSISMRRQLLLTAAASVVTAFWLMLWVAFTGRHEDHRGRHYAPYRQSAYPSDAAAVASIGVVLTAADAGGRVSSPSHGLETQPTERRTPKIVLGWTRMYSSATWWWLSKDSEYAGELVGADCIFTTDRSYLSSADLVVFHGCFQPHNSFAYPDYRQPSQRWVYLMSEAPTSRYCTNQFVPADGLFNLTATYKRDSDLVFSYSPGFALRTEVATSIIRPELASRKTKLAFWYMSDCSSEWSSYRSEFVKALRRYLRVDVFGSCRQHFPDTIAPPCPKSSDDSMDRCFLRQSKAYKFYLSFENAHCRDYITEKLFKVMRPESDVVPVAMGATIDDYAAVVPPDSFIHVSNFSSPERLAEYLHYLDENDDAYLAYHRWRERFVMLPIQGKNTVDQHPPSQLRQLCAAAHHPPPSRVWTNLVSWFSVEKNCKVVKDVCLTYGICENKHQ